MAPNLIYAVVIIHSLLEHWPENELSNLSLCSKAFKIYYSLRLVSF